MRKGDTILTLLIFVGLILGVLVGQLLIYDPAATAAALQQQTEWLRDWGDLIFIRPLRMMIIPLVFVSVVVGVTSIGNPQRLGLVGGATLVYYFSTMLLAVSLGLFLVERINPGAGVTDPATLITQQDMEEFHQKETDITGGSQEGLGSQFLKLLREMIPINPVSAAADGNTLGIVVFSILLGLALISTGEKARPAIAVFEGIFDALILLVRWIIWIAPLGVFLLVAGRVGEKGLGTLAGPVGKYMLVVLLGLLIHGAGTLPLILFLFGRTNPYRFLWQMRKALVTAFSTASSAATMPITIEEAEKRGGCSRKAANFVIPLGTTVNMDGTALYQAVAVVFLFQVYGIDLTLTQQMVILITATLAAVGTAAIPSAGLVTMAIVITAVNSSLSALGGETRQLPLEAIAVILGIDRILDMCRTCVNVWGDAAGARIMTRLAPDEEREREKALG